MHLFIVSLVWLFRSPLIPVSPHLKKMHIVAFRHTQHQVPRRWTDSRIFLRCSATFTVSFWTNHLKMRVFMLLWSPRQLVQAGKTPARSGFCSLDHFLCNIDWIWIVTHWINWWMTASYSRQLMIHTSRVHFNISGLTWCCDWLWSATRTSTPFMVSPPLAFSCTSRADLTHASSLSHFALRLHRGSGQYFEIRFPTQTFSIGVWFGQRVRFRCAPRYCYWSDAL